MPPLNRDKTILEHIISYCDEIQATVDYFGDNPETFQTNSIYRNACALCIMQIGELTNNLSEAFKTAHSQMPWREIKAMRNVVAHAYGSISVSATWETICEDIPSIRAFCYQILLSNNNDK